MVDLLNTIQDSMYGTFYAYMHEKLLICVNQNTTLRIAKTQKGRTLESGIMEAERNTPYIDLSTFYYS